MTFDYEFDVLNVYEVQSVSEHSLIEKLKKFYISQVPKHCDIALKCSDGKLVHGHKLIMAARSDYFDTLFQYEPEKSEFEMPQYDSKLMSAIVKSMVNINLEDIEEVGFVDYLQAADFLQLNDLVDAVSKLISRREINIDNVFDILEVTQNMKAPLLEEGCFRCIKDNLRKVEIQEKLDKLPKSILIKIFSEPRPEFSDKQMRSMDKLEVNLIVLEVLYSTLKRKGSVDEDLDEFLDKCFSKNQLYFLASQDKSAVKKLYGDIELDLSKIKLEETICARILKYCPKPEKPFDWPWRTTLWSQKFGNMYEIRDGEGLLDDDEWIFEGTFSKINVKTRIWDDNIRIVQGFQVFLDDGSSKSFGMSEDDTTDVLSVEIPPGKYVRDINMVTSWYIESMEFICDQGKKLGRFGNDLWSTFHPNSHFGFALDSSEVYKAGLQFHEHFLSGMRGKIMVTEGTPCICDLQFKFTFIPPPDHLKSHYDEIIKQQKDIYTQLLDNTSEAIA